jgi:hypothetical protein
MAYDFIVSIQSWLMRIPDDIEELVLAFMDQEKKKGLMRMSREEIDSLIMSEIAYTVGLGYVEKVRGRIPV